MTSSTFWHLQFIRVHHRKLRSSFRPSIYSVHSMEGRATSELLLVVLNETIVERRLGSFVCTDECVLCVLKDGSFTYPLMSFRCPLGASRLHRAAGQLPLTQRLNGVRPFNARSTGACSNRTPPLRLVLQGSFANACVPAHAV